MSATPFTFEHEVFHCNPDGTTEQRDIEILFDWRDGSFATAVPSHFNRDFEQFRDFTLERLLERYASAAERTSRLLTRSRAAVLMISTVSNETLFGARRQVSHQVGIEMSPVWLMSPNAHSNDYWLYERMEDGSVGDVISPIDPKHVIVEDTPEVRQQYERIASTIDVAARLLADLTNTADPTSYFLNIQFTQAPPQKEAAPATSDPAQPEIPFNTPNPDDEDEL